MGTSKGYIAPTTPQWSHAKRYLTSYLRNPTDVNKENVASGYADAMRTASFSNSRITSAFSGIVSFALLSSANGITTALQIINRNDILGLPPEEALSELVNYFSENGSTIDDAIALDCISDALTVLRINSLEDLSNIDINRFIKELVCQFAKRKFAQLFEKHIRNRIINIGEADNRLAELQEFIYYTLQDNLTLDNLRDINPRNLANEPIIVEVLEKAFELLSEL